MSGILGAVSVVGLVFGVVVLIAGLVAEVFAAPVQRIFQRMDSRRPGKTPSWEGQSPGSVRLMGAMLIVLGAVIIWNTR